ncbi:MAG: aldehyde dehydrogenase family protein [Varibaculum sp.]|nr:aldehyde dehydrogenase family protein [Varibaculum sp.]
MSQNLPENLDDSDIKRLAALSEGLTGEYAAVRDLHTGRQLVSVRTASPTDVDAAIREARIAQLRWYRMGEYGRSVVISKFISRIYERYDQSVALVKVLAGKAHADATDEVLDILSTGRACAELTRRANLTKRGAGIIPLLTNYRTVYMPVGVVSFFTLPDFPLASVNDLLQPLVSGNAVIEYCHAQGALGSYFVRQQFIEAGLPSGLWQIMPGTDRETGISAIGQTDHVAFMGPTEEGYRVATIAQDDFIPSTLFLSVKNSAIITADSNLEYAARALVRTAFQDSGQASTHYESAYVERAVYDRFLELCRDFTEKQIRIGTYNDPKATMGPLNSEAHLERVEFHVQDAVSGGANLLTGGNARPDIGPLFYEPTILTDVPAEAAVVHEETYGPVLCIYPYDNVQDAIERVNDNVYGYILMIYTADMKLASHIANRVNVAAITVNDGYATLYSTWDTPMQGWNESGNGIRHGIEGIRQYTKIRSIARMKYVSWVPEDMSPGNRTEQLSYQVIRLNQLWANLFVNNRVARFLHQQGARLRQLLSSTI